jgi:hypothetical protein
MAGSGVADFLRGGWARGGADVDMPITR